MHSTTCCFERGAGRRCAKLFVTVIATSCIEPILNSKLLLLIVALLLAGCGHKGPLYLPGQKPPSGKPATTQSAPPADTITTQP
jgi:predicted small lipoprotein YifL